MHRGRLILHAGTLVALFAMAVAALASAEWTRLGPGGGGGDVHTLAVDLTTPPTGTNFLGDPTNQWKENGPDGPGYYRPVGNSYEKLELGRDDDC